jgi:ATP-dependent Lon protease
VDHDAELPVLPVRDAVLFPGVVAPFDVVRQSSLEAMECSGGTPYRGAPPRSPWFIVVVTQRNRCTHQPLESDLYSFGCIAKVLDRAPNTDGGCRVVVAGEARVVLRGFSRTAPDLCARVSRFPGDPPLTYSQISLVEEIREGAMLLARAEGVPPHVLETLENLQGARLVDLVAGNIEAPVHIKVRWLSAPLAERVSLVLARLRVVIAERCLTQQ